MDGPPQSWGSGRVVHPAVHVNLRRLGPLRRPLLIVSGLGSIVAGLWVLAADLWGTSIGTAVGLISGGVALLLIDWVSD